MVLGIALIFLLFILSGAKGQKGDTTGAIEQALILTFIVPVILLFSIIIGVKRQSSKQKGETSIGQFSNRTYFIILFVLLLLFLLILFINKFILPTL